MFGHFPAGQKHNWAAVLSAELSTLGRSLSWNRASGHPAKLLGRTGAAGPTNPITLGLDHGPNPHGCRWALLHWQIGSGSVIVSS